MELILTHETFAGLLHAKFNVEVINEANEVGQIELELIEVTDLKVTARQEQFAILFRGPNEAFLGQGTRFLKHEQQGGADLFLVPVAQDAQGVSYEVVFNRIRGQSEQAIS